VVPKTADQGNAVGETVRLRVSQRPRVPQDYAEALSWFRKAADWAMREAKRTWASRTSTARECRRTTTKLCAGSARPLTGYAPAESTRQYVLHGRGVRAGLRGSRSLVPKGS